MTLVDTFGYPALFLLETLEGMGIPVPGEAALVASGIYAGLASHLNIYIVIIVSTVGSFLGDNLGYLIGHKKGEKALEAIFRKKPHRIAKLKRYFEKRGTFIVFIGRFTTFLRIFSPMMAGATKMNYKKFAIANFLGCFLWSLTYGYLSFYFSHNINYFYHLIEPIGFGFTAIIILVIIISIFIFIKEEEFFKDEIK